MYRLPSYRRRLERKSVKRAISSSRRFVSIWQKSPVRQVLLSSFVDSITKGGAMLVTTRKRCFPELVMYSVGRLFGANSGPSRLM
ncbi:hypothetical protein TYRP_011844 [Tyrophagus putrescentiae]|nr:hypothetical protein TYRP_011844 [Tyrophagus putrescentiae]